MGADLVQLFNNREIATVIWLVVLGLWCVSQPAIRQSAGRVLTTFLHWRILALVSAVVGYTAALVTVLWALKLWHTGLMKDTILWITFSAIAMVFDRVTRNQDDSNILEAVLLDNLKVIILLEFLINAYTLSLLGELLLLPCLTFIGVLEVVAKTKEEHKPVARICGAVLAVVGFGLLGHAVVAAISDYRNLGNIETLRSIALPILLSVMFVPFLYATVVLSTYERIFVFLRLGPEKPREVTRYARRRIVGRFGLRLRALTTFLRKHAARLRHVRTKGDVDAAIVSG